MLCMAKIEFKTNILKVEVNSDRWVLDEYIFVYKIIRNPY